MAFAVHPCTAAEAAIKRSKSKHHTGDMEGALVRICRVLSTCSQGSCGVKDVLVFLLSFCLRLFLEAGKAQRSLLHLFD